MSLLGLFWKLPLRSWPKSKQGRQSVKGRRHFNTFVDLTPGKRNQIYMSSGIKSLFSPHISLFFLIGFSSDVYVCLEIGFNRIWWTVYAIEVSYVGMGMNLGLIFVFEVDIEFRICWICLFIQSDHTHIVRKGNKVWLPERRTKCWMKRPRIMMNYATQDFF